jgi:hypothetical protein
MGEPLIQKSLVEIKLGEYGVGAATSVSDPTILPQVQNYKRQIASRLFPLNREDIDRKVPDAQYHVSRKIDGEFTVCVFNDGEVFSINPGGTVRVGLPWQAEAADALTKAGVKSAMIAGELYKVITDDRRTRVHDVVSAVRTPKEMETIEQLHFAVFDLISIDDENIDTPYEETWGKITSIFKGDVSVDGGAKVHPVETVVLKGHKDVERQFQKWVVDEGSEGIVVRSDLAGNFKIKPLYTLDAVVIGFTESTEDRAGMMHDLLLAVARADGALHVLCRVGGGFSENQRREMLSDLKDMIVESEYAEVNSDHVAYQMVKPEWVVEINCLDLISQNTRGGPINRMALSWNTTDKIYEVVRRLPLVSVISPQFVRIREDKSFNVDDIRISQITDVVPVPKADVDAHGMKLAHSSVMKREVFVKELKGKTMVRKFLMWKTNKESEGNEYPAFVIHFTDYSPKRKVPLDREVRISNSETQIQELWDELQAANIKKGWKPYEG